MSNQASRHIDENEQIIRAFFERFTAADVAGALSYLADDVVWKAMGNEGGPPMSNEMDKQAIGQLIELVAKTFPRGMRLTPTGWTAQEDRVAVEMESYGEKANGTIYNNFYHFLFIVSRGKIFRIREYNDTLLVKTVFLDDH
ncbi:nuclear transport factor 2 family protein [Pontibacter sp. G13]|uniref:nuclear transport factor 2 family protein n=1 Tax=Pontibacter sp. G13 TaxID=3074898 RepID=UPI00288951F7|nr:nuclear transport factor 2 family protein [Pontibacter sp. G13]WNJ19354.1 nuclear transport factor 2 family protein [Pontibacter sp. G13]